MAGLTAATSASAQVLDHIPNAELVTPYSDVVENAIRAFCPQMVLDGEAIAEPEEFGLALSEVEGTTTSYFRQENDGTVLVIFDSAANSCETIFSKAETYFDSQAERGYREGLIRIDGFVQDPRAKGERVFLKTDAERQQIFLYRVTSRTHTVRFHFSVLE